MVDTQRFAALLHRRLADLDAVERTGRDAARPVELDQTSVGRLSRMDALQQQAMALETERRRAAERLRIEAALQRIESGDYGNCVSCDEEITEKRLALDPAVPTCIRCAARGEA